MKTINGLTELEPGGVYLMVFKSDEFDSKFIEKFNAWSDAMKDLHLVHIRGLFLQEGQEIVGLDSLTESEAKEIIDKLSRVCL